MAAANVRQTRSSSGKRTKMSPIMDEIPLKNQIFKKSRAEEGKKISPLKEKMIWSARAQTHKGRFGRNLATDSEGELSETVEAAKLLKNLKIPKTGAKPPSPGKPEEPGFQSPLEKIAKERPQNMGDMFDALMGAFRLTNNNIVTTKAALQLQVDTVSSAVRTNTRAIIRSRKDLLDFKEQLLVVERQQLGNSMLVYDHGLGWEQLKSWAEREKAIEILLKQALKIKPEMDYLFKIVKTEVRIPKNRGPGVRLPPIKVFFPSMVAMDYLTTVIQYPSKLRTWHQDPKGERGSLARFSIKPNVAFGDRQRAAYARQIVANIRAQGTPENIRYEATPYRGIRKIEDGRSRTIQFEWALQVFSNFLPREPQRSTGSEGRTASGDGNSSGESIPQGTECNSQAFSAEPPVGEDDDQEAYDPAAHPAFGTGLEMEEN